MDCEEQAQSSCLIDHCYVNDDIIREGAPGVDDGDVKDVPIYQVIDPTDGSTVLQLEDGRIVIPDENGLIQLEDGSLATFSDGGLKEDETNCFVQLEDGSVVQIKNDNVDSQDADARQSAGYYIQLGNQLLFIENGQQESMEGYVVEANGAVPGAATPAMGTNWVVVKDDSRSVGKQVVEKSPDFSEQDLSSSVVQRPTKRVVMLNAAETNAAQIEGEVSVKIEVTENGSEDFVENYGMVVKPELADAHEPKKISTLFTCKECGVHFVTRNEFVDHKREHHHTTYLCDICGQGFGQLSLLRSHKVTHEVEENSFKCHLCSKEFVALSAVKEHLKQHHPDVDKDSQKLYKCEMCDARFMYSSNLSRHRKTHSEDRNHVCEVCGKGFYQKSNLRSHQQLHAELEPDMSAESLPVAGKYRRPKQFSCNICGKGFANLSGLKNHDAMHTGVRPHVCATCGKSFALLSCLKTHMSTIHSDITHLCQICGKGYRNANYLKLHIKIHAGKKDFHCDTCSKAFVDNPSLKLHLRTHTGEKPYSCFECNKSFTQQAHLKTHLRTHTGEKPYKCSVCQKAFRQLSNKIEHERIHKRIVPVLTQ